MADLNEQMKQLAEVIKQKAFQDLVREISGKPAKDRKAFVKGVASANEFNKRGIQLLSGMNVTHREFDTELTPSTGGEGAVPKPGYIYLSIGHEFCLCCEFETKP